MKSSRWWLAPKALRVFPLILLVLMMGAVTTTTTGCGGGIAAAILCPPCSIVIIAAIGVTLLFEEMTEDDCNCDRPPRRPPPPPPPPPPPLVEINWFCVQITNDSECPIDGIFVSDPNDPSDVPMWVFGGPQAYPDPDDNAPPGSMIGLPPERMIWPDRGPQFPDYRNLWQSCQQIFFGDAVGNADHFMTTSGAVNVTIHFENEEELDLGPQFVDHGTTFVVKWHNITGAELINIIP